MIYRLLTTGHGLGWFDLVFALPLALDHYDPALDGWNHDATVPILLILMFALASASYYWIEYPFDIELGATGVGALSDVGLCFRWGGRLVLVWHTH